MCAYYAQPINIEYLRDLHRGRIREPSRFYRIEEYAKARWEKSREARHYSQWQKLLEAVKRRRR